MPLSNTWRRAPLLRPCLAWALLAGAMLWTSNPPAAQWLLGGASQIVEVEGRGVHVLTAGFEQREPGQPAVILQSHADTPVGNWSPIFRSLADIAPLVAYDRPGLGQSEAAPEPSTPERMASHLRTLLAELDVAPPYVLVGHRWGGILNQYFAAAYPDDTAGLVFIAPPGTGSLDDLAADYAAVGAAPPELDGPVRDDSELIVVLDFLGDSKRELPSLPDVPMAFLLAGNPVVTRGQGFPPDTEAVFHRQLERALENAREIMQASSEAVLHLANHTGRYVHHDDPLLVIDAIRRVVFPDIGRRLNMALETGGTAGLIETYRELRRFYPPERFDDQLLSGIANDLGAAGRTEDAIALLELNVDEFPASPYAHFNLGVGYGYVGRAADRLRSFERAVELAEEQDDPLLPRYRGNLENAMRQLDEP